MSLLTPNSLTTRSAAANEAAIFLERQRATVVWVTQMDRLGMSNAAFVPDEVTRRELVTGPETTAVQCSTPGYGVQGVNSNVMKSYVLEARAHRPPPAPPIESKVIKPQQQPQQPPPPPQQQQQQQSEPPVASDANRSPEKIYANNSEIHAQRMISRRELAAEKERARQRATQEDDRLDAVGERAINVPTVVVLKEPLGAIYEPDVSPPPSGSIGTALSNIICSTVLTTCFNSNSARSDREPPVHSALRHRCARDRRAAHLPSAANAGRVGERPSSKQNRDRSRPRRPPPRPPAHRVLDRVLHCCDRTHRHRLIENAAQVKG